MDHAVRMLCKIEDDGAGSLRAVCHSKALVVTQLTRLRSSPTTEVGTAARQKVLRLITDAEKLDPRVTGLTSGGACTLQCKREG